MGAKVKLNFYGKSIQNLRKSNMDRLVIEKRKTISGTILIAAVCDGVGSLENGELASHDCAEKITEWFIESDESAIDGIALYKKIEEINKALCELYNAQGTRSATTLSCLLVANNKCYIINSGDSRIYSYSNDTLNVLTRDDVNDEGKLTSAICKNNTIDLFYKELDISDSTFLICSDGLYKRNSDIRRFLIENNDPKRTVSKLINFAVKSGETDNISAAIVKISVGR
jgi:serine/threonine protein phosphatase PrpC